jgi:hypothetical protein
VLVGSTLRTIVPIRSHIFCRFESIVIHSQGRAKFRDTEVFDVQESAEPNNILWTNLEMTTTERSQIHFLQASLSVCVIAPLVDLFARWLLG